MRTPWLWFVGAAAIGVACGGSNGADVLGSSDAGASSSSGAPGTSSSSSSGAPDGGTDTDSGPAPPWPHTIPLALQSTTDDGTGQTKVAVQLKVGTSAPFPATFDTGSNGIVALPGAVPASAVTIPAGAQRATYTYGSGVQVAGVIANAVIVIGDLATPQPIDFVLVDTIGCVATKPSCAAAGQSVDTFKFSGTFGAIFGVGMRSVANGHPVQSPLLQLGGPTSTFVIALGPQAGTPARSLILEPDAATVARFTNTITFPAGEASILSGVPSYDDRTTPFCINGFCGQGLLDTGGIENVVVTNNGDYVKLGAPVGAEQIPAGKQVTVTINTASSFTFTVGTPPTVGVDRIAIGNGAATATGGTNLGRMTFYRFDALYDPRAGKIALAAPL